jgi:hypothetical protein
MGNKKTEQIVPQLDARVPQLDASRFIRDAIERSWHEEVNEITAQNLGEAEKITLQKFMLRKRGSARDYIKDAQTAIEMAVNDMAEARMAEWLLARRNALLEERKERK